MKIQIEQVVHKIFDAEVSAETAFNEISRLMRKKLNLDPDHILKEEIFPDNTTRYELLMEQNYIHGSRSFVVVEENPTKDQIDYLLGERIILNYIQDL